MTPLAQFVREYLLALQFFTRIPVTGRLAAWVGYSPELLRASAAHFPGVGALVGGVAAFAYALLLTLLPVSAFAPLVAAVLSTVLTVLLTGGFHEDGLADVSDGLGGSSQRERALEIMKDSRVGAFGAMALMLALLAKVGLLALIGSLDAVPIDAEQAPFDGWLVCAALWAGHVLSRGLPLLLIRLLPHVGDAAGSKSKPLAEHIDVTSLVVALCWCLAVFALVSLLVPVIDLVVAASFAAIALLWMGRLFQRRLGGFTGDCLGATQQVCEIAFYFGLAVSV